MELSENEKAELLLCKRSAPFREWFAVKCSCGVSYFDAKRKATNYAKTHAPAAIYAAQ